MGIAERKEREKREMRERILDAAMKLFVQEGFEKTSIRKIANAIEYSPGTIYLYFKDKTELFFDLHTLAFQRFGEEFSKANFISDPYERLVFLGKVYMDFALKNPEYYDLMFILRAPMREQEEDENWEMGKLSFDILEATCKEAIEAGKIKGTDHRIVAYNMWAQVHGLCALATRDRMRMHSELEPREIMEKGYQQLMEWVKM